MIAAFGEKQAQVLNDAQEELSALFQETADEWRSRAELERDMTAELTRNLTAVKSVPDAVTAYSEWVKRHLELANKDGQKFFANAQKLVGTMSRLMTINGERPHA